MSRVYFIKPIGLDGPIKIGCSGSPEKRRRSLATWSPFALEIVAEINGGFDLEHRFHALFQETHQRREWFGQSKRMATVIAAINDGTFDVNTLPAPMHISARSRKGKGSRASEWTAERRIDLAIQCRARALRAGGVEAELPYISTWGLSADECLRLRMGAVQTLNAITANVRPKLPPLAYTPTPDLYPVEQAA